MEMLGLCAICGKPAMYSCSLCGRVVCQDHFYPKAMLCSHCISPSERKHSEHNRPEPELFR